MYNIIVLMIISLVINKYTLQKKNAELYLFLRNYLFPIIFFKRPTLYGYFSQEKYNTVDSKKIDNYLNYTPFTSRKRGCNKFKFYLFFYRVLKKFFVFGNYNYFILFIKFVNYNIFVNKFYFNPKARCWFSIQFSTLFFFFFLKVLIVSFKFKTDKYIPNLLKLKKIKYVSIFNKFSKIVKLLKNLKKKIFNFKNVFNKLNLKNFFSLKQFFLRKTKCFNKSRYSRNRQNYRTGFYLCLYVNVIALVGLNFLFYKFIINFTAIWYLFYFFIFIFFFSKFFKYNYINFYNVYLELEYLLIFFSKLFNIKNTIFF